MLSLNSAFKQILSSVVLKGGRKQCFYTYYNNPPTVLALIAMAQSLVVRLLGFND